MKLVQHEGRKKDIREVTLVFNPLTIWVSPLTQLVIEPGDTLREVAEAIGEFFPLSLNQRYDLVAYWFALGERIANETSGPWTKEEMRARPSRTYLNMF